MYPCSLALLAAQKTAAVPHPAGYITLPGTRWDYHVKAVVRARRLLPFATALNLNTLGLTPSQRSNTLLALDAANAVLQRRRARGRAGLRRKAP